MPTAIEFIQHFFYITNQEHNFQDLIEQTKVFAYLLILLQSNFQNHFFKPSSIAFTSIVINLSQGQQQAHYRDQLTQVLLKEFHGLDNNEISHSYYMLDKYINGLNEQNHDMKDEQTIPENNQMEVCEESSVNVPNDKNFRKQNSSQQNSTMENSSQQTTPTLLGNNISPPFGKKINNQLINSQENIPSFQIKAQLDKNQTQNQQESLDTEDVNSEQKQKVSRNLKFNSIEEKKNSFNNYYQQNNIKTLQNYKSQNPHDRQNSKGTLDIKKLIQKQKLQNTDEDVIMKDSQELTKK